ncbi:glycosyltransferase [Rapidithrix thailandica]|uniref:Glycosyltransferase n=1 Tax=Rapidithrix thailandica TaxID=413964 RepID=A0AAW9S7X8_9BACT
MTQVLYLSYDGMTDPLGQSQVIPYLKGIAQKGYQITLISFEKEENQSRSSFIKELLNKANIQWVPLTYTKRPPVLSTLWDIFQLKKTAKKLHRKHQFQIVHCRSYITALVGLGMKRKYGVKFVFDMRGFWADERLDGNIWDIRKPVFKTVYNFFKKKEIQFLQEADYTVSLTHQGKDEIASWPQFRQSNLRIKVIPCCVDRKLFDKNKVEEAEVAQWRTKLQLRPENFILSYLGSIGTWYMLPEMLSFFKKLLKEKPEAIFLFITADDPEMIKAQAKQQGIDEKYLRITRVNREEVPAALSLSNLSVFFIKPAYSKKASSPTKQGELMSMGVPVICNAGVGDTDFIVNKYQSGWVTTEFSEREFERIILQLNQLNGFDNTQLQAGADDYFALSKGISSYLEVYQKVLNSV